MGGRTTAFLPSRQKKGEYKGGQSTDGKHAGAKAGSTEATARTAAEATARTAAGAAARAAATGSAGAAAGRAQGGEPVTLTQTLTLTLALALALTLTLTLTLSLTRWRDLRRRRAPGRARRQMGMQMGHPPQGIDRGNGSRDEVLTQAHFYSSTALVTWQASLSPTMLPTVRCVVG